MTEQQQYETWSIKKPPVVSEHGLVSSQHYIASNIGANVLRDGGNAIDAAVAASLSIGTVEPWMSGLGGAVSCLSTWPQKIKSMQWILE